MTQVLPLAVTMMAGPQIMSAIIFVTHRDAVRVSAMFLAGVLTATVAGLAIADGLASLLGSGIDLGDSDDSGSTGNVLQLALVVLLVAAAIRNYVNRETVQPPAWLGKLQEASPSQAFKTGLLVILLMPSDVIIMLTVGVNLETAGESLAAALPFIGATLLIAALPLLGYLLFHRRAVRAMPSIRDWMRDNAWLVNVIVLGIFVVLILS